MKKKQIAITLGIVCFILTIAIAIQLKTIRNTNTTISQSLADNALRDEVLKWKEKYDVTYKELASSEKELDSIRKEATRNDTTSQAKQEEIKQNNMLLGMTNVQGSGIEIVLKDNLTASNDPLLTLNPSNVIVHNIDLIEVINALKNAGAEAISVNGQRVVPTTSITCVGNVIKINGQKIGSPFVIRAIGNQELLYGSLVIPGGYLNILKDAHVVVEGPNKVDHINIEKYDGVINFKYIKSR
ncbi:MAG: DUF881 domain-containing protein [Clostridia bacterium]|nr:DUF881 domain-containing protein [Clostridia bacterium]